MKKLLQEMNWVLQHKLYTIVFIITALCGYGFMITHATIGIDDTAMELYLQEGYMVEVDRWVMYLLNKIFYFGKFAPFLTDFVGVLFLMLAGTMFCVLFRRILGDRMGVVPCTIFSCLFISNPIISAVYIYYFHNGIGVGYIMIAISLLCFEAILRQKGKAKYISMLGSTVFLWIAIGCYESFLILFMVGVLLILFLYGIADKVKLTSKYVLSNLLAGAGIAIGSMLLRAMIVPIIIAIFQISGHESLMSARSMTQIFTLFTGDGIQELIMLIKRYWVVYHVNAIVYLPITGLNIAYLCVGIYALVAFWKRKNLWYPVLVGGMIIAPFLLVLMEKKITFYRTCQYLPFVTAIGFVLLYLAFNTYRGQRFWRCAITFFAAVFIYNQASELNYNFYMDYQEYLHEKEILVEATRDVQRQYGTDIPIVFTGEYDIPYEFMEHFYVGYNSWQYKLISSITDLVDIHLKEKYFQPQGYCFCGERNLPLIRWGFDAFDGTNRELVRFLKMHGYTINTVTDLEVLKAARSTADSMPKWPQEGSIVLQDGYVLVNF